MPLEVPNLDRRTYDALRSEALLRAVRYTPDWTDQNPSDPGVTLIELFAWYTELLFRELNRVPELNYVKFLQLLGMQLSTPIAATADVTFTVVPGANAGSVPRHAQLTATNPAGGPPLVFETERALDLVQLLLSDVRVYDGVDYVNFTDANSNAGMTYPVFGWQASGGCALLLGFSAPQGSPPPTPAFPGEISLRVFAPVGASAPALAVGPTVGRSPVSPVTLVWEYRPVAEPQRWQRVEVVRDDTAGFTRDGYITLSGPPDAAATPEALMTDARYWLRCRIQESAAGGYAVAPLVDMIVTNTVPARNLASVANEFLGQSGGRPSETFTLSHTPVDPGTLVLVVDEPESDSSGWAPVPDFLAASPDDSVYTLDAMSGIITFPDGRYGRILPEGSTVTASAYRYGGGSQGNVAPGGITTLAGPSVTGVSSVTNLRPAVGGADEQTVAELSAQAPGILRAGDRAVTVTDFAALAVRGGDVARATAVAQHHPDFPDIEVPGAVTVVIVPSDLSAPNPTPSADLLRAVAVDLDDHRLITTEVFVVGPDYQEISVRADVVMSEGSTAGDVVDSVESAINAYLDPLQGGSVGDGWPFGANLIPTNLYRVIGAVDGVLGVTALEVTVDGRDHPINTPVAVPPTGLLYGGGHDIRAEGATG